MHLYGKEFVAIDGPKQTHRESLGIINEEVKAMESQIAKVHETIKALSKKVYDAGGPMIQGIDHD